jgi:hypothetical protein
VFLGAMFLGLEGKMKCSIYLLIIIQLAFVVYLAVFRPYMQKMILIR